MIGGLCFGILTLVFLVTAFLFRNKLLPEEEGQKPILTSFPMSVHCCGLLYAGPFSRLSLYSDFLVIRALGASIVIRPKELSRSPETQGGWIVLPVDHSGQQSKIKVSTDNNSQLVKAIEEWRNGSGS